MLTIGHSTLPIDTFLAILRENGVSALADIRTIPKSRHNPQFAQENLSRSLAEAGIDYRWHKSLGGLRHPHKDSVNTGWRNTSFRGYADYMQTPEFAAAISDLLNAGPSGHIAIVCAEAVPWRCHRSLVADALTVRGVPVEHIYYDAKGHSRRESHKLTSFLRVQDQKLWYPAEDDLFASTPPALTPEPEPPPPEPPPASAPAEASSKSATARSTRGA